MNKLIATVSLYLASGVTLAANLDEAANVPAVEVVPTVYVVLFVVLFFGMIIGFFGWLWWNEKHRSMIGRHTRKWEVPGSCRAQTFDG